MSEELIQRNLIDSPEKMGDWNFYNIGATTLKALKSAKLIPDKDYETFESKKPDALIVKKPVVIAAIEYKTPSQLRTEKQIEKAIVQELLPRQAEVLSNGECSFSSQFSSCFVFFRKRFLDPFLSSSTVF